MLEGVVAKADGYYYYELGNVVKTGWIKVDNDYYCFSTGGKALTGYQYVGTYLNSTSRDPFGYGNFTFAEDGKLQNGLVHLDDGVYYYENGITVKTGWILIDGEYYFFTTGGKAVTGKTYIGTYATNKSRDPYKVGTFEFSEEGKLLDGIIEKEDGHYYYVKGIASKLRLVKHEDEYYYVDTDGKLSTGRFYVGTSATNNLLAPGYRTFAEDGHMYDGIEEIDGELYYYELGNVSDSAMGLILIGEDLYYVGANGKLVVGERFYVGSSKVNGYVPNGYYTFDEDGKLIK